MHEAAHIGLNYGTISSTQKMERRNMTTAEKLVKVLTEKKMTCATAESCTGGA